MTHDSTRGRYHNGLAWVDYDQRQHLIEAEELAREAVRNDPEELLKVLRPVVDGNPKP
ncbi:MAG: hypothetical protein GY731_11600 [Gammaproteobacteria bacterium]|nr:hypothetical protein [Gammaproteobacteria bacterium]